VGRMAVHAVPHGLARLNHFFLQLPDPELRFPVLFMRLRQHLAHASDLLLRALLHLSKHLSLGARAGFALGHLLQQGSEGAASLLRSLLGVSKFCKKVIVILLQAADLSHRHQPGHKRQQIPSDQGNTDRTYKSGGHAALDKDSLEGEASTSMRSSARFSESDKSAPARAAKKSASATLVVDHALIRRGHLLTS